MDGALNDAAVGKTLKNENLSSTMAMKLSEFIPSNMEAILQEWESFARDIWPGNVPDTRILRDHAEEMLNALVADIQTPQSADERRQKSLGRGKASAHSDSVDASSARHAESRVGSGFDLRALVSEYRALRASILHLWSREGVQDSQTDIEEVTRFNEAIDQLLAESVLAYSEKVNQSREIFLGILGHDLRSPLNAVSMLAGLLAENEKMGEVERRMASQIADSVKAMNSMVVDLLDFAATRLGTRIEVFRNEMDLESLCREVVHEVKAAHPEREIFIEANGNTKGEWDWARLRQVVSNLVRNAIQHGAASGPIRLTIDGTGENLVLGVHNEGTPIPEDALTSIFEPFRRNRSLEDVRPAGSIGLGLYIARQVAEAHGGTISVSSTHEQTSFVVTLPRRHG